jgi:hypothetical protein
MIFFLGLSLVLKNFTILLLSVYWDPGQGEYLLLITGFFLLYDPFVERSGCPVSRRAVLPYNWRTRCGTFFFLSFKKKKKKLKINILRA